jgi:hypothetical protein
VVREWEKRRKEGWSPRFLFLSGFEKLFELVDLRVHHAAELDGEDIFE